MSGPGSAGIACPGCGDPMRVVMLARSPHGATTVDLCGHCRALWLDTLESTSLAPEAIVALFREVTREAPARRALPAALRCPRCRATLSAAQDLRHTTRFTYWRCPKSHGRFTPFVQFLREKDFIRPLSAAEIARLKAYVASVRCSGCGAPVDLARDMACTFCRAPLEVLDQNATAKALAALDRATSAAPGRLDVDALAGAIAQGMRAPSRGVRPGAATDLIGAGVALVLEAIG